MNYKKTFRCFQLRFFHALKSIIAKREKIVIESTLENKTEYEATPSEYEAKPNEIPDKYKDRFTNPKVYSDWLHSNEHLILIEKGIPSGQVGFGNPRSKLTAHEQFLCWVQMLRSGWFQSGDRDTYCNLMLKYSTYQEACNDLQLHYNRDLESLLSASYS